MIENSKTTNLFPPQAVLATCEELAPGRETSELYDRYWIEITSA
jgi:hypothetical protein